MEKIDRIVTVLKKELCDGKYPVGSRFPSEYELAERFNVNKKTANKAVSLLAAENLVKRGIGRGGTTVLRTGKYPKYHFVFFGAIHSPYYSRIAYGIQHAAIQDHSIVTICSPGMDQMNTVLQELRSIPVDGILSANYGVLPDVGLPVLYLEDMAGSTVFPEYVACDSYAGGYQLMKAVLEKGHRDIVMIYHSANNLKRLDGMFDAMKEFGIQDCKERAFILNEDSVGEANINLSRILKKYPNFTAALTCSDDDTFRLIKCLNQRSIDWEGKIALGGFGNLRGISDFYPIATVEQHPFLTGIEAYKQLVRKIRDPELKVQKLIETEVIRQESIPVISSK